MSSDNCSRSCDWDGRSCDWDGRSCDWDGWSCDLDGRSCDLDGRSCDWDRSGTVRPSSLVTAIFIEKRVKAACKSHSMHMLAKQTRQPICDTHSWVMVQSHLLLEVGSEFQQTEKNGMLSILHIVLFQEL